VKIDDLLKSSKSLSIALTTFPLNESTV